MANTLSLLRTLKRDRSYVYRLAAFVIFISLEVVSVVLLDDQASGKLQFLRMLNAVVGTLIAITFVVGAVDLAKRNMNYAKSLQDKEDLQGRYISTRELLFRIDNETREEVGAWLHGKLQPQLTRLARDIRTREITDLDLISQQIDEISEEYVRKYSHDLYPPGLAISLEVALETLLDGRAELVLDERLTNAADVGFPIWSREQSDSALPANQRKLRLHLGAEIAYATYRIIEEAVANAEKKSDTTRIGVEVRVDDNKVRISIRDNGSPVGEKVKAGLGLSVIESFMQKFDGTMSISNISDGVELLVSIPYQVQTVSELLNKRFSGGGIND